MLAIIAISGNTKVTVLTNLTQAVAASTRRELVKAEENFDMLGNQICKYRLKKVK